MKNNAGKKKEKKKRKQHWTVKWQTGKAKQKIQCHRVHVKGDKFSSEKSAGFR